MDRINPAEILAQIDAETMKSERIKCAQDIEMLYDGLVPAMAPHGDKLNATASVKYILEYLLIVFGYAKEISLLQKTGWNNSISGLTRNLLECYAYAKKLIQLYGSADYDDYVCNLIVIDMEQDRKVYNSLKTDTTIIDTAKRDLEAATYITRFENLIATYFSHKATTITAANKIDDTLKVIRDLNKEYNVKYPENTNKSAMVSNAIQGNTLIAGYDGSEVVYRVLCHSTHNTVSSLEDRTLRNGMFMLNNANKDLLPCIQLSYFCMKDCFDEFMKILAAL